VRLADKVAIITGAGSGIGRATAQLFAREGARVVVAEINAETGAETARRIVAAGGVASAIPTDVTESADIQRMIAFAVETYGALHILMNNACWSRALPAVELAEEDWERTIAACLRSVYLGAKYAIPHMIAAGGGSIINISSVNGLITNPGFSAYSAAKAGVLGLTRNLALDYGRQGIRVNAICPGFIASNERSLARLEADPLERRAMIETQVLDRWGRPEDIASAALFLASDESSFMTGATLVVDGGLTIQSPEALVRPSFRRRWRPGVLVLQEEGEEEGARWPGRSGSP
jgi:NAD(P)-dependent dehydrogenase (short-subunit alcohol dehydrogenase family)